MRLIDADALRKNSKMLYSIRAFEPVEGYTQDQIDNATTVDAVPVAHGRWEQVTIHLPNDAYGMNKYNLRIKCTNCGFVTSSDCAYVCCPNCGAKMDVPHA